MVVTGRLRTRYRHGSGIVPRQIQGHADSRTDLSRALGLLAVTEQLMAFGPELIGRKKRPSRWICEPGWHVVEITGYRRSPAGRGGAAVFVVRDDGGRELEIRFSLSIAALCTGDLLRFWAAASNRPPFEAEGCSLSVANARTLRPLVGRRLAVLVDEGGNGLHQVIDWKPIEMPA